MLSDLYLPKHARRAKSLCGIFRDRRGWKASRSCFESSVARSRWPPPGAVEIEQLSAEWQNPELSVNIENGFGFFGAIARYTLSWTLDEADLKRLGYKTPG